MHKVLILCLLVFCGGAAAADPGHLPVRLVAEVVVERVKEHTAHLRLDVLNFTPTAAVIEEISLPAAHLAEVSLPIAAGPGESVTLPLVAIFPGEVPLLFSVKVGFRGLEPARIVVFR